ncbi:serine/threonine protein kinase [Xylanimonas cellulosilytica DSM 15894]|uniref:Serine/threonine protein kinase n=1 Tax=Xylanimonas cellulosilytica (strain DSM 15894 / JCM 12276 / CECT 5975 / KCTC 9989 / LMG 20990 / NBRC 107835 / XIL07) TaxID=446471 RepID=D1BWE6_XYLCX|nr:hypothetical protein [Xylanimonas cellulosilytica]ACZ31491.1 serine/threonine protein kinase [Xylanimonas cellulosilytica DSM 15894]
MPLDDDAFAQTLSRIAADVAPDIDVDTSRVVPTARRRRDRRRSLVTASLGVAVLAGVGFSQAPAWTTGPVVAAQEPAHEAVLEPVAEPAIAPFDAVGLDDAPVVVAVADSEAADGAARLPAPVVGTLGVVGLGALGTGAWFLARSRRYAA